MPDEMIDKGLLRNICRKFPRNPQFCELMKRRIVTIEEVKSALLELSEMTVPARTFLRVLGPRDHPFKPTALRLMEEASQANNLMEEVRQQVCGPSGSRRLEENAAEIESILHWRAPIRFPHDASIKVAAASPESSMVDMLERKSNPGVPAEVYLEALTGVQYPSEEEKDCARFAQNAANAKKILAQLAQQSKPAVSMS